MQPIFLNKVLSVKVKAQDRKTIEQLLLLNNKWIQIHYGLINIGTLLNQRCPFSFLPVVMVFLLQVLTQILFGQFGTLE